MRQSIIGVILTLLIWSCKAGNTQTYDNGQYHPSSYSEVHVVSTTYSASIAYVTQANAVVTVTSYIPCPVTSTVYVYQCGSCATPTPTQPPNQVQFGTTTVTRYTTVTPGQTPQYQTVTSNGYVIVITNPTGTAQANVNVNTGSHVSSSLSLPKYCVALLCASLLWAA